MTADLERPSLGISEEQKQSRFEELQENLLPLWRSIETLSRHQQTIVVVPSLTVDYEITGSEVQAYEERFLFLLLLLRQPNARLIYVTSQRIKPSTIDYYLDLLPGVIASHARKRLFLVAPEDGGPAPLSVKLLCRPGLLEKLRRLIGDPKRAHLVPFNTTELERDLALVLGVPMYGADPKHLSFGTKSGCRRLFAEANIPFPAGYEDLASLDEVVDAVREAKRQHPRIQQLMLKHNDGVSGEGNAVIDIRGLSADAPREDFDKRVRKLTLEAPYLGFEGYFERLRDNGGIVEERILAKNLRSPSVQLRITPLGKVELLSTHDQLLGGPSGQSFLGCVFPADQRYAPLISDHALKAAEILAERGVLGRFAIDFIVGETDAGLTSHAIELNLRKGGTTHPFLTLQFLTDGQYDAETATFTTPFGQEKYFVASDHVEAKNYRALVSEDVFDLAVQEKIHFDQSRETGVVFHMLASIGDKGRLGLTAVENTPAKAMELYQRTLGILDDYAATALESHPLIS